MKEICLLCGRDIHSPFKEKYEDRLLRIKETVRKIIWDNYKDPLADIVARGIILAIEQT